MKRVIVGLDVGTSSLKAAAVAADGTVAEYVTQQYAIPAGYPQGIVPVCVYDTAMKQLLEGLSRKYDLAAISVTTQMYSLCEETPDGLLAYQWNCLWKRDEETERHIGEDLIRSGCRPDTLYPAYKLASLPPGRREAFLPYGIKECLIRSLCGALVTDYSTACASGLFDTVKKEWNEALVKRLGYTLAELPAVRMHDQPAGYLLPGCFEGACAKTLIVPGLGDGPSASLACRGLSSFGGNLGTSMAARVLTEKPDFSEQNGLWNLAVDDKWYAVGGISSNSCTVLQWARRTGLKIPEKLTETNDVRFFPWLHGERTPYWSSDLRAAFTGLTVNDDVEALGSAVCKAVAFTFVRMARAVGKVAPQGEPLVLLGGGTNLAVLLSVISGCVDREILLLDDETYLGALGAAVSACTALGVSFAPRLCVDRRLEPDGLFYEEYTAWDRQARLLAGLMREQGRPVLC